MTHHKCVVVVPVPSARCNDTGVVEPSSLHLISEISTMESPRHGHHLVRSPVPTHMVAALIVSSSLLAGGSRINPRALGPPIVALTMADSQDDPTIFNVDANNVLTLVYNLIASKMTRHINRRELIVRERQDEGHIDVTPKYRLWTILRIFLPKPCRRFLSLIFGSFSSSVSSFLFRALDAYM